MADEYEIMPHKEILEIKKELEKMRASPKGSLDGSLNRLSDSIDSLMGLFKNASEDIKMEQHDDKLLLEKIEPLFAKLEMVIEQNEKIAKGIVAIADMIKRQEEPEAPKFEPRPEFAPTEPRPEFRPPEQQRFPGPERFADFPPRTDMPRPEPRSMGDFPPGPGSFAPRPDFQQRRPPRPDFGPQKPQFRPMPGPDDMPPPPSFDEGFPEPKKRGLFSKFTK
jgi:hypothetical protein